MDKILLLLSIFACLQCKTTPKTPTPTPTPTHPSINLKSQATSSDLIPSKPLQDPHNFPAPELKVSTLETDQGPLVVVEVTSQNVGDYTQISVCPETGTCLDSNVSFKKRAFPIPSKKYTIRASSCVNSERSLQFFETCGGILSSPQSFEKGLNPANTLALTTLFLLTEKMRTKAYSVYNALRGYKLNTYQEANPTDPFDVKVENGIRLGAPVLGEMLSSSMFADSFAVLPKKDTAPTIKELKTLEQKLTDLENTKPSDSGPQLADLQDQINQLKDSTQNSELQLKITNLETLVAGLSTNKSEGEFQRQILELKQNVTTLQIAKTIDTQQQIDIEALRSEISSLKEASKTPKDDQKLIKELAEKVKELESREDEAGIGAGGSLLISLGTIPALIGAVTLAAGYYLSQQKQWIASTVASTAGKAEAALEGVHKQVFDVIDGVRTQVFDIVDGILMSYDFPALTDETFKMLPPKEQENFRKIGQYYFKTEGTINFNRAPNAAYLPPDKEPHLRQLSFDKETFESFKESIKESTDPAIVANREKILYDLEESFPEKAGKFVQIGLEDPQVASRFYVNEAGHICYATSPVETSRSIPHLTDETLRNLSRASVNSTPGLGDALSTEFKVGNQWETKVPLVVERPNVPHERKFALLEPPEAMKNKGVNWFKDGADTITIKVGGEDRIFTRELDTLSSTTFKSFEFRRPLESVNNLIKKIPTGFTSNTWHLPNGFSYVEEGIPKSLLDKADLVTTTLYKQFLNTAVINHNLKLQTKALAEASNVKTLSGAIVAPKEGATTLKTLPASLGESATHSLDRVTGKLKTGGIALLSLGTVLIAVGAATDYLSLDDNNPRSKLLLLLSSIEEEVIKLDEQRKSLIKNFDPVQDQWLYTL